MNFYFSLVFIRGCNIQAKKLKAITRVKAKISEESDGKRTLSSSVSVSKHRYLTFQDPKNTVGGIVESVLCNNCRVVEKIKITGRLGEKKTDIPLFSKKENITQERK